MPYYTCRDLHRCSHKHRAGAQKVGDSPCTAPPSVHTWTKCYRRAVFRRNSAPDSRAADKSDGRSAIHRT